MADIESNIDLSEFAKSLENERKNEAVNISEIDLYEVPTAYLGLLKRFCSLIRGSGPYFVILSSAEYDKISRIIPTVLQRAVKYASIEELLAESKQADDVLEKEFIEDIKAILLSKSKNKDKVKNAVDSFICFCKVNFKIDIESSYSERDISVDSDTELEEIILLTKNLITRAISSTFSRTKSLDLALKLVNVFSIEKLFGSGEIPQVSFNSKDELWKFLNEILESNRSNKNKLITSLTYFACFVKSKQIATDDLSEYIVDDPTVNYEEIDATALKTELVDKLLKLTSRLRYGEAVLKCLKLIGVN